MLAKHRRLSKADIDLLFKQGESFRTHTIYVRTRPTSEPCARFCILFSKNNKLSSVDRNRLRRQTYAQIEKKISNFSQSLDYGLMLTPKFTTITKENRMKELENLLNKLTFTHE